MNLAPFGEVVYGPPHDLFGDLQGTVLIELHVGGALNFHFLGGGNNFGMEILGQRGQSLHNTLNVHYHCFHSTGEDSQLLVQEITSTDHTLTHQGLVGGAADTGQIDTLGPLALSIFNQLRVAGSGQNHLTQSRFMTVNNDVNFILLEDTQICLGYQGARGTEEHIRNVTCQHTSSPTVGEGAAHSSIQYVLRVLIVTDMGAMQNFDNFAVNATRDNPYLAPYLLTLGWRPVDANDLTGLLAELSDGNVSHIRGDFFHRTPFHVHAQVFGQGEQLIRISDLIVARLPGGGCFEGESHIPAVIRVGGRTGGYSPGEVSGDDGFHSRATHAGLSIFDDPARSHKAVLAAQAIGPNRTRLHRIGSAKSSAQTKLFSEFQHLNGGRV